MKRNENRESVKYSAPETTITEIAVENGFATSGETSGTYSIDAPDYGEGETI